MKVLLVVLFTLSLTNVFAQKKSEPKKEQVKCLPVTDSDYYAFYNSNANPYPVTTMSKACNPDSLPICNLTSLPEYNVLRDDTTEIFMDTLFTKDDRAYIKEQMIRERKFRWKDGELKNIKVIDGDKLRAFFDSLGVEEGWKAYFPIYKMGYNKYSVPFFSCNKQRCIIFRGYECGMSYGLGNTNVYEKRNGKWVLVKSCAPWIH